MSASANDDVLSRGAQAVRGLLERHGIPKHRHSAFVGEFFELSRAAAHQRVSKSTAWTLEELSALAEHFGETLAHVVAPLAQHGAVAASQGIDATLCVGEAKVACRIWLRPGNVPSPSDVFVALLTGGDHVVMPMTAVPAAHALRVARLELAQSTPAVRRMAVLDADARTAELLCEDLRREGMEAASFSATADLLRAAAADWFDGYVIDWPVPNEDAHILLSGLRAQNKACALVLVSSRMRVSPDRIADLAQAVERYKAQFLEKPVPLSLMVAALQSGFAA